MLLRVQPQEAHTLQVFLCTILLLSNLGVLKTYSSLEKELASLKSSDLEGEKIGNLTFYAQNQGETDFAEVQSSDGNHRHQRADCQRNRTFSTHKITNKTRYFSLGNAEHIITNQNLSVTVLACSNSNRWLRWPPSTAWYIQPSPLPLISTVPSSWPQPYQHPT